jgi:CBS domain containing-hemolysin-like protein
MSLATSLILVVAGIAAAAFFAAAETALTALPLSRVTYRSRHDGALTRRSWLRWRNRPHRMLVSLLIGNTALNIGISAVATGAAIDLFGDRGVGVAVGIVTFAVLIFSEVTPKALARMNPEALGRRVIVPAAAIDWALTPVTVTLLGLSQLIARLRRLPLDHVPVASTPEDLLFLIALSRQEGHLSDLQEGMLKAVLRFENARVRDVQTPRTDVVFLPDSLPIAEVRDRVLETGYSRYPVYHDRDDNVIGILLAKHLLRADAGAQNWTSLLLPPLFVPESKLVVDLLREMREARGHVALAVDEHGNIAGLVTLEDVLELIVGDIEDEFDTAAPIWRADGPSSWVVRGAFPLDRLAGLTGVPAPPDIDYASVGGLLLDLAGRVPPQGSTFSVGRLAFDVLEASTRRVELVRIRLSDRG